MFTVNSPSVVKYVLLPFHCQSIADNPHPVSPIVSGNKAPCGLRLYTSINSTKHLNLYYCIFIFTQSSRRTWEENLMLKVTDVRNLVYLTLNTTSSFLFYNLQFLFTFCFPLKRFVKIRVSNTSINKLTWLELVKLHFISSVSRV